MSSHQILVLLFVSLIIIELPAYGLYKMFQKAGVPAWKGLVPFYNTWVALEISKRPKWWFFAQFIPVAGWFFSILILIEFVKCFGKYAFYQHVATAFFAVFYFIYVGSNKKDRFIGPEKVKLYKKSVAREWIDAAVFAIVAATLIRIFVFEAYVIPTPSMEKTLLVDDYLFVSKFSYGPRIPNTPLALPFMHHTIPGSNIKSYVEWIEIPYTRWFASPVQRNDVVVFNFPVNDTLINDEDNFGSKVTYYEEIRKEGSRDAVWANHGDLIITRPVDKRENFIKRCVAIAGDSLQVENSIVFINGAPQPIFPQSERYYSITIPANINTNLQRNDNETDEEYYHRRMKVIGDLLQPFGINARIEQEDVQPGDAPNNFLVNITNEEKANLKLPAGYSIENHFMDEGPALFPYYGDTTHHWKVDNYGPLWIPKKGVTIPLTPDNLIRYQRCIEVYEGNKFENDNGKILINGVPADSYTFKMDYYWMMGDNRHNSLDSRFWGFVPEDHVVGKASLIWFSTGEGGPRWKRLFSSIK
jgi:signal peptidase I